VYETEVREPLRALVEEMDVFRIHREVRFSAEKSPYKTDGA